MADKKKVNKDLPIRCECGKIVAFWRDGKLFIKCKRCKRETEIEIEPRALEARGH